MEHGVRIGEEDWQSSNSSGGFEKYGLWEQGAEQ